MTSFTHFYDTFGYLVVRNLYHKSMAAQLQIAYDRVVTSHFRKTIDEFLVNPVPVLNGVEMSQELLNFLPSSRILPVVDELIGDDAVFWGSDLSTFKSGSQYHRDTLGDYKLLKIGIYLQDSTVADGGQFTCLPGSHHFGDRYSDLCSQGLRWPRGGGYADNVLTGEFDCNRPQLHNSIPAVSVDLAVGDVIFFNQALIHSAPATARPRRMIALTFFEGEKSFNARPHPPGEFAGLSHADTLIALRVAVYLVDRQQGKASPLNYHERLGSLDPGSLRKYLREFTSEQFDDVHDRVLKKSYQAAYRFINKTNPV